MGSYARSRSLSGMRRRGPRPNALEGVHDDRFLDAAPASEHRTGRVGQRHRLLQLALLLFPVIPGVSAHDLPPASGSAPPKAGRTTFPPPALPPSRGSYVAAAPQETASRQ
jgi:hypothetical protein